MTGPATSPRPRASGEWGLALGAALATFALFVPMLATGRSFYWRDVHLVWHPQVETFVRCIAAGSWPLWDRDTSFGQPLLANPQTQVLYPPRWLALLMPAWTYYPAYVAAHLAFAAAGTTLLARRLGATRAGALLAAGLWIGSGPMVSLISLWHHLAGAAWMPWVLLAARRALTRGGARRVAVWGAAHALQVLAGSPDMSMLTGAFTVALTLLHVGWRRPWWGANRACLGRLMAALGLGAALSAAQWLPTLDAAMRTERWNLPAQARVFWSVPPLLLAQTVAPVFIDRLPLQPEVREALFESREPFLKSLYLGLCSVALVLAAPPGRVRTLLRAVAAFAGVLALGEHVPVYEWLVALTPGLRMLRYPVKAMVVLSLAWALLAGLGLSTWVGGTRSWHGRRAAAALLVSAAVGTLVAAWRVPAIAREWGAALLDGTQTRRSFVVHLQPTADALALAGALALAAGVLTADRVRRRLPWPLVIAMGLALPIADVGLANSGVEPTAPAELFKLRPPALRWLPDGGTGRVFSYDYFAWDAARRYMGRRNPYVMATLLEDWPVPWAEALALRSALYPGVLAVWGVETAFDTDRLGVFSPAADALTRLRARVEGTPAHLRLLRLGAVSHVVALHRPGFEDLREVATLPTLFREPLRIYAVPATLPRAYVVGGVRVATGEQALRTLVDPAFDPWHEVLLPDGAIRPADPAFRGLSRLLDLRPDHTRVAVETDRPAHLVIVDAFDPGWRATVDGRAARVIPANAAFQAVAVPAGRHQVEVSYRPWSPAAGLALSLATVAVGLVLMRPRPPKPHGGSEMRTR